MATILALLIVRLVNKNVLHHRKFDVMTWTLTIFLSKLVEAWSLRKIGTVLTWGMLFSVVLLSGCQHLGKGKSSCLATQQAVPSDQVAATNRGGLPHQVNYRQPILQTGSQESADSLRQDSPGQKQGTIRSLFQGLTADSNSTNTLPTGDLDITRLGQQDLGPIDSSQLVADLVITGNRRVATHEISRLMSTRPGRFFDPDRLQEDVEKIWRMPDVNRVLGPFLQRTPQGVVVSIEIQERNVIEEIRFVGNRGLTDRQLLREAGLETGQAMDAYQIRMAKSRIEELYKTKGFPRTQIEVLDGEQAGDDNVVFLIHEDQKQRIWKAQFEGNNIASDARLRSLIESKPGILKMFGGLVNRDSIEQDILKLTNYYRSLGFFNARIGREIQESNDGRWMTIRFIIDEGPRYRVRDVRFVGNQTFSTEQLERLVKLRPEGEQSPEFNVARMNSDVVTLRDLYGSQGFVFADVVAEPRFLEEPGELDIVYRIEEGKQYRVGEINVYFEGNYGITRREVVMNRLSLRPGDLIDVREIRDSERRMNAAQIFADPSTGSPGPKIVIRPPELKELERHAQQGSNFR